MKSTNYKIGLIILTVSLTQLSQVTASDRRVSQGSDLLTAKQLVTAVLLANPQLGIAQAAWQASLARIDQQASFEDPMFSYHMAPQTIGNKYTEYGQRIEISQKLPWPGKLHLRHEAASHEADAANQTINRVRLKLSVAAKSFFADWYYIHQAIRINQLNQALLKEFRVVAVGRYSTGLVSKQDTLRADMEFALLQHQAIVLVREQGAIRTHINTLLNQLPESVLAQPAGLAEIETLPNIKLLYEQALHMRPELKVLAVRMGAAQSHSELTIKNNYPDISLKAGYNSLWENSRKHFTVGIGFNLSLFQGKRRAAENEARAQIKQVEWQRIDFIAKLREEIQISYDRAVESKHVLSLYKHKLLPLAKATLDAATSDYQSGKGDFLSLIRSEKDYMHTQLQTEQVLADTHRRLAELERAVGHFGPFK